MKKSLLALAFTAMSGLGAFAQSYYYFKNTGVPSGYSSTAPTNATAVITGSGTSQSNTLSAAQNIPFSWSLYGVNVSQFKASTSGYITFDVSTTADNSTNEALPSVTAPKLAIFGFWDKTRIQALSSGGSTYASGVKSWTTGTAPNRVFHIQWQLVQTDDGTNAINVTYYAILLNENGTFDIVHDYGFGAFTATAGIQNLDGTEGTMVDGSPNMNFGGANGSYDPTKSLVYSFRYGIQPAVDLEVIGELTPPVAGAASGGANIKVKTVNYGSNNITSAKMNYSVNNGTPVSAAATISVDKNGGRATITYPTAYVPADADANTTKTIRVWFSEINGGSDYSDTIAFDIFQNKGISGTKRVLIEEGSGAWCGYCPDGHYKLKTILENNPDKVVAVVHHNSDVMAFPASEAINSKFATGYPYGAVDRTLFDDQTTVGLNRGLWADKVTQQLNQPTPVNVSIINKNFDWAAGKVTYTVKVDFVDYAKPGDIRISSFIKEDKVRGPNVEPTNSQLGWNQHNYYTYEIGYQAGGPSHPLYEEPFNIIGYWHNEVVRAIPSGSWGSSNVITDPSLGQSYTVQYTHTMTKANSLTYTNSSNTDTEYRSTKNGRGWNKYEDTKIVAFVNYYDAANPENMSVLNAIETNMINTGINETTENNIGDVTVYPNPANGVATVDFNLTKGSTVTIEAVNVLGQKVADIAAGAYASGSHSVYFDAAKLNAGIYFINVTSEDGKASHRFVVTK